MANDVVIIEPKPFLEGRYAFLRSRELIIPFTYGTGHILGTFSEHF